MKNQGGEFTCTDFSVTGLAESITGLYFNQNLQLDLSEEKLRACSPVPSTPSLGNTYSNILNYLISYGICEESACPYINNSIYPPCESITNYDTLVYISGYRKLKPATLDPSTFPQWFSDTIKYYLNHKGPLLSGIQHTEYEGSPGHAMLLIGYGVVHIGDTIELFDTDDYWSDLVVQSFHGYAGRTYWIYKNSWGESNQPYVKILFNMSTNMIGPFVSQLPIRMEHPNGTAIKDSLDIVCEDRDGDGYYNWGIGPKPNNELLRGVWPEPDGDDTDSTRGPMDEYGYCESTDPDTKDTIFITSMVTDTLTKHIYQHVVVTYGGTWCPGPRIFHNGAKLFIRDGGRVSCGYTMENLDLHMDSGGTFSVDESWEETTGKVIPVSGKGFSVPPGGRFELNKGKITNH